MRLTSTFPTLCAASFLLSLTTVECLNIRGASIQNRLAINARHSTKLRSSSDNDGPSIIKKQSQIATLNSMAAKLRAEAAELEVDQQKELAEKLAEAFKVLDTNNDGSISVEELRTGLALQLQSAISEDQAAKIMKRFDVSGDGSIQLDEFKGVEAFRNILEKTIQEEKTAIIEATQKAIVAKKASEAAAAKANAIQEQVNSLPPSGSDKIVSLLPYLLPLADVLPYSKEFIVGNHLENNNLIFEFASSVFLLYQSIPFSGLVAFFLLNILTNNLKLNRLIRFNMQQAIYLDIALIFPSLIGSVTGVLAKQGNLDIPPIIGDTGSTATFLLISAGIVYSMASSLLGIVPDKIPIISERALARVPTAEDILKGIEAQENEWKPPGPGEKRERKNRPTNKPEVEQVKDADVDSVESEK